MELEAGDLVYYSGNAYDHGLAIVICRPIVDAGRFVKIVWQDCDIAIVVHVTSLTKV